MAGSYLLLCLLCCLCCLYPIHASLYSLRGIIRAPSVIPSKDVELHKYCAVLAATEPYKEVCVQQIRNFISPLKYWTMRIIGKFISASSLSICDNVLLQYVYLIFVDILGRKSDFQQADAIRDIEPCVHFALERYETSVRDAVRYELLITMFK